MTDREVTDREVTDREVTDREANRFSARAARYARVGANMSGVAARLAHVARLPPKLGRGIRRKDDHDVIADFANFHFHTMYRRVQ